MMREIITLMDRMMDTDVQQKTLDIDKIKYGPIKHTPPDRDPTETTVCIANLSTDTTKHDLIQLLGLSTTSFLWENVRLTLFFNRKGKYKVYALVIAPKFVYDRMCQLNGIVFNSRTLSIEILSSDKSITLYDRPEMLRGSSKQSHFPTSGNKAARGDSRPVPNTSSRQEENMPSTNWVEDESEETNPEGAGGGSSNAQDDRSMAEVVRDKHNRQLLEERKRCQLLIDIWSEDEGVPSPSASMIYKVLTEQLGLPKDPSNGVKTIYMPNPSNSWRWLVFFVSENVKTKFEVKKTTLTFTHKNDKTDYTYTFITRGGTRSDSKHLMITVQSSPLIPDEELGSFTEPYRKIAAITPKKYGFAKHIDSGLRLIFITLHKDVKTKNIPMYLHTSDGVWKKLFFKDKLYTCRGCGTQHMYIEGCPTSQHN